MKQLTSLILVSIILLLAAGCSTTSTNKEGVTIQKNRGGFSLMNFFSQVEIEAEADQAEGEALRPTTGNSAS